MSEQEWMWIGQPRPTLHWLRTNDGQRRALLILVPLLVVLVLGIAAVRWVTGAVTIMAQYHGSPRPVHVSRCLGLQADPTLGYRELSAAPAARLTRRGLVPNDRLDEDVPAWRDAPLQDCSN